MDPELYNDKKLPPRRNPYQTDDHIVPTVPSQQTISDTSEDEWGRFGPHRHIKEIEDHRPLPTLHSYKLVNHVRVPYTG